MRSTGAFYAKRFLPGEDLKVSLLSWAKELDEKAISLVSCVGSLKEVSLRLAGSSEGTLFPGPFEILSLVGTLCEDGAHLHLCLSDRDGKTLGGHLLDGSIILTTAEVVVVGLGELQFSRDDDPLTGYKELLITKRANS